MERKTKTIIVITLCVAIVGLSVGYAALNSILNIAGNAKVGATAANWNISFKNVNCEAGGYAEAGSISSTGTTITISESKLKAPKDYVICTFDVVNDGTIDAEVTSVTVPDPSSFTYEGTTTTDEELVKNGLVSEMKYNNTNKDEIKIGDKLKKGASKAVYIKIEYSESVTKLPTNEVAISDIFGQIVFGQSGSIGSEEGGGSEDIVYSVGDAVYYNPVSGQGCSESEFVSLVSTKESIGENPGCLKWYVISDSGNSIEALLYHNTSSSTEWNSSGNSSEGPVTANNQLANDVSSWSSEAKSSARLISADETAQIVGQTDWSSASSTTEISLTPYPWIFENSDYWTSSPRADSNSSYYAWYVDDRGKLTNYKDDHQGTNLVGVRPVITISKSNLTA